MTVRAAIRQADVRRAIRGALEGIRAAGFSPDQFEIIHRDGETHLLPASGSKAPTEADDLERRMKDAFGA